MSVVNSTYGKRTVLDSCSPLMTAEWCGLTFQLSLCSLTGASNLVNQRWRVGIRFLTIAMYIRRGVDQSYLCANKLNLEVLTWTCSQPIIDRGGDIQKCCVHIYVCANKTPCIFLFSKLRRPNSSDHMYPLDYGFSHSSSGRQAECLGKGLLSVLQKAFIKQIETYCIQ